MARSPFGVAIGVSGETQGQVGQPAGQLSLTGAVQRGGPSGPPGTTQQSSPGLQHSSLQHCSSCPQLVPAPHSGAPHVPSSQNGKAPLHSLPQVPQFLTSLFV